MDNTRHNDPDFSPDDGYLEDDASQSIVQGGSFEQKVEEATPNVFQRFIRAFAKSYRRLMDGGSDPIARKRRARYRNKPSSVPAQVQLLEARILMSGTSTTAVLSQPLTQVQLNRETSTTTTSPTSTTSSSETSTPQVTTFAPLGEGVHTGEVTGVLDNGIGVTVWNGTNRETGQVSISNTGLMTAGTNETLGKQHLSIDFDEGREHVTSVNLLVSPDFIGSVLVSDIEGSARQIYVMGGGNYLKTVNINETCGSLSLIADQGTGSLVSMTFAPSTKPDTAPDLSTQTFQEFWAKAGAEQLKSGTDAERNILQTIETMKFDTTDQLQEVTEERTQLLPIIEDLKKPTTANVTQTVIKPVAENFAGLASSTKEVLGVGKLSTISDFGWTVDASGIYKTTTGTWGSFGFELVTPLSNATTQVTFSVTGRSQLQVRGSNFSQTLLAKDLTAGTHTVTLPQGAKYVFISVPSGSGTKPQFLSITTNRTVTETVQKVVPADPLKLKHAESLTKVMDGLVAHAKEEKIETQTLRDTFESEMRFAREPMLRHATAVHDLTQKISALDSNWSPKNFPAGTERAKAMHDREAVLIDLEKQTAGISSLLTTTYNGSLTDTETAVRDEFVQSLLEVQSLRTSFDRDCDALRFSVADRTYGTLSLTQNFTPTVTAVSTDNAFVAAASSDGRIVLYASGSGEVLHTFSGFTGTMNGLTFVNPTTLLVSTAQKATLVDLTTNTTRAIDTQGRSIMKTQVMAESGTIAFNLAETGTAQRMVRIVKTDGTLVRDIPCGNSFDHITFSDDCSSYVFFEGSWIYVRNTATGKDSFSQYLGNVGIAGTVMDGNGQAGRIFTIYNDAAGTGYITAHTAQGSRLSSYNFPPNSAVIGITDLGDGLVAVTLRQSYPSAESVAVMQFSNNTWTLLQQNQAPTAGHRNAQTVASPDRSTVFITRNDGITAFTLPSTVQAKNTIGTIASRLPIVGFGSAPGDVAGMRFTADMKARFGRLVDTDPVTRYRIDDVNILKGFFYQAFPQKTDEALRAQFGTGTDFYRQQLFRDEFFDAEYRGHIEGYDAIVDRMFIAMYNAIITEAQYGDPTTYLADVRVCQDQLRLYPRFQGLPLNRLTETDARRLVTKAILSDPQSITNVSSDYDQGSSDLWRAMNSPTYGGSGSSTPTPRQAYEAQVTATRTLTTILQSEGTSTPELRAAAYLASNPAAQQYVSLLTPTQQTQIASGQVQWSALTLEQGEQITHEVIKSSKQDLLVSSLNNITINSTFSLQLEIVGAILKDAMIQTYEDIMWNDLQELHGWFVRTATTLDQLTSELYDKALNAGIKTTEGITLLTQAASSKSVSLMVKTVHVLLPETLPGLVGVTAAGEVLAAYKVLGRTLGLVENVGKWSLGKVESAIGLKIVSEIGVLESKVIKSLDNIAASIRITPVASNVLSTAEIAAIEGDLGHVLVRHVGKSVEYLESRIVNEGIPEASTFTDAVIARKVIWEAIQANAQKIAEFKASSLTDLKLEMIVDSNVGTLVKKSLDGSSLVFEKITRVVVLLQKDSSGIIYLLTSFLK